MFVRVCDSVLSVCVWVRVCACLSACIGVRKCVYTCEWVHVYVYVNVIAKALVRILKSQRRDRGIYSIRRGRSLHGLHFGISQLIGPEACFWIFVTVLLG